MTGIAKAASSWSRTSAPTAPGWAAAAGTSWPTVSTSFALLFLSKGRTPVLISKLAHGIPVQRRDVDTDWNNDRNDLRNLVDFRRRATLQKAAARLANLRHHARRQPARETRSPTRTNWRRPPSFCNRRSSTSMATSRRSCVSPAVEKKILQRYIDNGGFIFAEACCGSPAVRPGLQGAGRRTLARQRTDGADGDHPVWKSHFPIAPGNPYKLLGLNMGCKTVLIYSPQDLSCHWESNNVKNGKGLQGVSSGHQHHCLCHRPRAAQATADAGRGCRRRTSRARLPRGYVKVAQIRHRGDWQPAPKAMRNLMDHLHKVAGLDVVLKTEDIPVDNPGIVDFKFLYMHGRGEFRFDEEDWASSASTWKTAACCSPTPAAARRHSTNRSAPSRSNSFRKRS